MTQLDAGRWWIGNKHRFISDSKALFFPLNVIVSLPFFFKKSQFSEKSHIFSCSLFLINREKCNGFSKKKK
jgi:hypothetical protein